MRTHRFLSHVSVVCAVAGCLLLLPVSSRLANAAQAIDEEKLSRQVQADLKRHDFDAAIRRTEAAANHESPAMVFGAGVLYVMKAYDLRKYDGPRVEIRRAEDRAFARIKLAAKQGDESARSLYRDIRRHGRDAMYFISLDHLMPE